MEKTSRHRHLPLAIAFVVFWAGFSFLVLEVSWNRLLSLVLGTTVVASTLVLAAFMAGLGAGAYVVGRLATRSSRPGRLLAILLAGIANLSAFSTLIISNGLPDLYRVLAERNLSTGATETLAFGAAALCLFAPTFLMGGVLPTAARLAARSGDSVASMLGRIYAAETFGSAIGGLVAGFVLLGTLGQRGTVAVAVVIDIGLAIWLLFARAGEETPEQLLADPEPASPRAERRRQRRQPADDTVDPTRLRAIALAGTFFCGLSILGLQVLWLRIFRIYLTNTSYTFALVSSLVILGAFIGSAVFARRGPSIRHHGRAMMRVLVLMAITTAAGLVLLVKLPQVLMFPFESMLRSPAARMLLLPGITSLLVTVPPAAISGFAFPLACRMLNANRDRIGHDVGLVLFTNTAGAVVGPPLCAFVLLPWLGSARAVLVLVAMLVLVGLWMARHGGAGGGNAAVRWSLGGLALALIAGVVLGTGIRILPPSFLRFDRDVLFYRESVEGTLSVAQDRGPEAGTKYTFVNNSAVIGSSYDAIKVVKMVGHFPFLLGLEARDVLVVGFGIGVTTSAIAAHPEVATIECVELVAGLRDAAVYYRDLNRDVASDPRLSIIGGDGRHHLQRTGRTYDLISCDPTHPILGSGNLYTSDYFALCRAHLNPGGMVSQYLPLHKLRTKEFLGIVATFGSVFPHSTVWLGHYHAVLLGSLEPVQVDFADWSSRVEALGEDPQFYSEPYHLAATLVLDSEAVGRLTADRVLNTDDRCYTEFFAPACLDADNIGRNLRHLNDGRSDISTVFVNVPDVARMARFTAGNKLMTTGLVHKLAGDDRRSRQALQQACQTNPENQEYPFLMRLYF